MTVYIESLDEVTSIHGKTIEVSGGGVNGIISLSSLEAALEHVKNDIYYPEFVDKLTHLFYVANKRHCFQDGNKRIAISLGALFLLKNGYLFVIERFLHKMEVISYQLAAGRIEKEFLREIIQSVIYEDDYSEDIKLRLIACISNDEDNTTQDENN
ncbi:type II toxin-antitoxin system death-on-curing family toxin [Labilibaculum euxinus]|uniref:Type II toxin-antitoxin system death-on-curing family toxin n=1 Tax=Labilibaculum euxinus TaxID=2686357 RepID=A0A7M4DB38_9BACT|nr:type II toxin-antitoxin system death-on-curing family toxin [Labilibaculum euxinus]MUP39867.1 type II toxin-antitoxin system death-on-curing family toxin [Labilibaculum euxinus]MVB09072.1 type II toxin-antitoxin system death-on-curing family toxin [Labilibaculum euxinus]